MFATFVAIFIARFVSYRIFCQQMAASMPQKGPTLANMPTQQQPPHMHPGPGTGQQPPMPPQGALREISPVYLCRIGQETVQDIVSRTMEVFQLARATQVS